MFANAFKVASAFTFPVLIRANLFGDPDDFDLGTMTVINSDGWAVTADHVFKTRDRYLQDVPLEKCITFGHGQWRINPEIIRNWLADLALVKLEPFDPADIPQYPVIKNPNSLPVGTSLCALGYPFFTTQYSINENEKSYAATRTNIPGSCFPVEGIFTQEVTVGILPDTNIDAKFLEISNPTLRGQSGGPLIDTNGVVWGIACKTQHVDMNYKMISENAETGRVEIRQFYHYGWAVHPETLIAMLHEKNIEFRQADY